MYGTSGGAMQTDPTTTSSHAIPLHDVSVHDVGLLSEDSPSPWIPVRRRMGQHDHQPAVALSPWEHEHKVDRLLLAHKHHAQIRPGRDQAYLVANPFGDHRSLGVIDGDALFAVVPTLVLIDLRDDGVAALREDLVHKTAVLPVEHLALPADQVRELGLDWREDGARRDDDGALAMPIWDVAGGAVLEQLI